MSYVLIGELYNLAMKMGIIICLSTGCLCPWLLLVVMALEPGSLAMSLAEVTTADESHPSTRTFC